MSSLNAFLNRKVAIITTDGKYFVGKLEGYDNLTNVILTDAQERIILKNEDSIVEEMGLLVVRGDLVSTVGLVDEEIDKTINWTKVHGDQLVKIKKSIK